MKNLSEKTLLVNLTINQWTARKYDRQVSRKIEKEHNAHNAGRYNKILIAEEELKEIQKISSAARVFLYENTLPWGDNGDRLLPATNYFEFVASIRQFKTDFESAVSNFVHQYSALKEEARNRLNGMFQESDYPSSSTIKDKFNIDVTFMPISDPSDFRLQIDEKEVKQLKNKIETEVNIRIAQATKSIWNRIKDAVGHMVEKLSEKDAIFRDSLVNNIMELVSVLPKLNFTQDEDIANTINSMKTLIVSPDALRTDVGLREQKAIEAKKIMDRITDFIA